MIGDRAIISVGGNDEQYRATDGWNQGGVSHVHIWNDILTYFQPYLQICAGTAGRVQIDHPSGKDYK